MSDEEIKDELSLILDGVDVNGAPPTQEDELKVLGQMYEEVDGVFL